MVFVPDKLHEDFEFDFEYNEDFEEIFIDVDKQTKLHGLFFPKVTDDGIPKVQGTYDPDLIDKPLVGASNQYNEDSDPSRGLVFYLHGNSNSLALWGQIAPIYTHNDYDFFIFDYRGFGKSDGYIESEQQLFSDIQIVYDHIKHTKGYTNQEIVIIGYSIGTCLATYLAAKNTPDYLILNAPYFSLTRLIKEKKPYVPGFLVKFKLETCVYIQECTVPIIIFHGEDDQLIPIEHSLDLSKYFDSEDELFILRNTAHANINQNKRYQEIISRVLARE